MSKMQEIVSRWHTSSGRSLLVMLNLVNMLLPWVYFQHWKQFEVKLIIFLLVHPSNGVWVNYSHAKYIYSGQVAASMSFSLLLPKCEIKMLRSDLFQIHPSPQLSI